MKLTLTSLRACKTPSEASGRRFAMTFWSSRGRGRTSVIYEPALSVRSEHYDDEKL